MHRIVATLTEKGHGKSAAVANTPTQEQMAEPSQQRHHHVSNGTTAAADPNPDQSGRLASVAAEATDLQKAVTQHQDAAICNLIWQRLVYLAEPAGQQISITTAVLLCLRL